ncbi:MAG TPA: nucleotide sugar dehydrogenase [Sphingomicrobium sp.]|nr:nucleotide sugar dehydrogenase [Sphingomicrobium sp.]
MERLSIFGLGYVGTVCAACFAAAGHRVIGVDRKPDKVALLLAGTSPIIEKDIDRLVASGVAEGRLDATASAETAVLDSDISLICVGTPGTSDGAQNLDAIRAVCHEIGTAVAKKNAPHLVVIRSTVMPGTVRDVVIPAIEAASGKSMGNGFDVAINPEFMREGSAVDDFHNPGRIVVGTDSQDVADRVFALYRGIPGEHLRTEIAVAELIKFVDNSWHALKVVFGNEIGAICKSLGIDSRQLIDVFLADQRLNLSATYLRPGFAFGGSCLPKDVRALSRLAVTRGLDLPVLQNVIRSNIAQIDRGVAWIIAQGRQRVSFLGLAFKPGTDDLRESPFIEVVERLIGKGYDIRIFDPNVELSRLIGANRDFLLGRIPHIARLLVPSLEEAVAHAEVIVLTNADPAYGGMAAHLKPEQRVLDFGRGNIPGMDASAYEGFSW